MHSVGIRRLWQHRNLALAGLLGCVLALPLAAAASIPSEVRQLSEAIAEAAEKVMPGVVTIETRAATAGAAQGRRPSPGFEEMLPPELRERFGLPESGPRTPSTPRRQGQGSGFVISEDGYILTNHHVVDGSEAITVRFEDGRTAKAELVGSDAASDVAVIKIESTGLTALPLGSSAKLRLGDWVLAIGSPFGLTHSVTAGIISAKQRRTGILGAGGFEDFLQTDAAINPGNSGGPLINLAGEVIGINSAIFSRSGGYMGIGFAIPIDLALPIKDQLIAQGQVVRGYLGVVIQEIDADLREAMNLSGEGGIVVAQVAPDSPAAAAGVQAGDVIFQLDGKPVADIDRFRNRIASQSPGSSVELEVRRGERTHAISVKLGQLGGEGVAAASGPAASDDERFGLRFGPVDAASARQLGLREDATDRGALITSVARGSIADQAGLQPGMLISRIGETAISGPEQAAKVLRQWPAGRKLPLLVRDQNGQRFLVLAAAE